MGKARVLASLLVWKSKNELRRSISESFSKWNKFSSSVSKLKSDHVERDAVGKFSCFLFRTRFSQIYWDKKQSNLMLSELLRRRKYQKVFKTFKIWIENISKADWASQAYHKRRICAATGCSTLNKEFQFNHSNKKFCNTFQKHNFLPFWIVNLFI